MPNGDLQRLIDEGGPEGLNLFKQRLRESFKTLQPPEQDEVLRILPTIRGMEGFGQELRPTPVQTVEPADAQWWHKPLEAVMKFRPLPTPQGGRTIGEALGELGRGAEFVHKRIEEPFAAALLSGLEAEAQIRAGKIPIEFPERPFSPESVEAYRAREYPPGVKGAFEMAPWFALPTGTGIAARAGAIAARGGKLAGVAGAVAKGAAPIAAAERALVYPITKPLEAIAKKLAPRVVPTVPKVLELPTTKELLTAVEKGVSPRISRIPGVRDLVGRVKFALIADEPIKAGRVIQGQMQDMAEAGVTGALAKARSIRPAIKVTEGVVNDPLITQVKALPGNKSSMAYHEIVEYAPRYAMPNNYRAFFDEVRDVSKAFSQLLLKEKVPFRQLKGESDFAYLHRVVVSVKEDAAKGLAELLEMQLKTTGQVIARATDEPAWEYLSRVMFQVTGGQVKPSPAIDKLIGEIGKLVDVSPVRQALNKPRHYDLVADGMRAGVKYADDPLYELAQQGRMTYDMIIKKRIGEMLAPLGVPKSALIAEQMGVTPEALRAELMSARQLLGASNRAIQGGTVPAKTLDAIGERLPSLAGQLKAGLALRDSAQTTVKTAIRFRNTINRALRGEAIPKSTIASLTGKPAVKAVPEVAPVAPGVAGEIEHAKGVLAARDLGGVQVVGAKNIAAAEKTLQKAGLLPTERKLPAKNQLSFIKDSFEKRKPVVGDSFVAPTGERIEITKVYSTPTGGTSIDYMEMFGKGRVRTIHTTKDWITLAEAPPTPAIPEVVPKIAPAIIPSARTIASMTKQFPDMGQLLGRAVALKGTARSDALRSLLSDAKATVAGSENALKNVQNVVLKDIQGAAKDEIIKAQVSLGKAARIGEELPSPEMGQVIGVPGISGRFIKTQIINGKRVEGRQIAEEIRKTFGWQPAGVLEKTLNQIGIIGGVMRMGKLAFDLSAQLIQTGAAMGTDFFNIMSIPLRAAGVKSVPIYGMLRSPSFAWAKGFYHGVRSGISKEMKYYDWYWAQPDNQWFLQQAARRGALIEPAEAVEQMATVARAFRKIPKIGEPLAEALKQSWGRAAVAFTGTRNITANEMRKALWNVAEIEGKLPEMARASNLLTGVLSTRGMGIATAQRSVESGLAFLSPRFTRAVSAILGHMIWNPTSWTGREAMRAVTGLMSAAYLFFGGGAMALGQDPKLDPRPKSFGGDGADWLTFELDNRRIGLGGMLSDLRAVANIVSAGFDDPESLLKIDMSNPLIRRVRAKIAPPTALVWDYISGRNYIGQPTRGDSLWPTKESLFELGKWGLPVWVEGMVEEGVSLPAVLAEFFGGRTFPESLWTLYQKRVVELSGKDKYDDISNYSKAQLEEKYPELVEMREAASAEMERRGYNSQSISYWDARATAKAERIKQLEAASSDLRKGKISGRDFRGVIQDTGGVLAGRYMEIDKFYPGVIQDLEDRMTERNEEALEKGWAVDWAYRQYWNITLDPALKDATGQRQYDVLEERLGALRQQVGETVWAELEKWNNMRQEEYPFEVRAYYAALDLLKPYWNISNEVWAQYPPDIKQESDRLYILADRDEAEAKRQLYANPQVGAPIFEARKRIALERRRMRLTNPNIDMALKVFY